MSNSVILATAGYDHKIHFWEAPSGACLRTLWYPESQVNCLQISPDKQLLAAAGNPHIRLFEIGQSANPNPINNFEGHTNNITSIGFHKDCKWMFSASEDGFIKIWDLRVPGSNCQRNYDNSSPVNSCVLHPNGNELISGDAMGNVRVWDLTANKCVSELVPEQDIPICSVSIAPDCSLLVAGNNKANVFVWKPEENAPQQSQSQSESESQSQSQSQGQQSQSQGLPGYHQAQHRSYIPIHSFNAHNDAYLLKCVFSPDSKHLVTTSSDRTAKLWDVNTWETEKILDQHQRWVWDAVFSADSSYLVTASSDNSARLWDLRTGDLVRHYTAHSLAVICVSLNDSPY